MYGIFTYMYPINDPNVGKYTVHGASGYGSVRSLYQRPFVTLDAVPTEDPTDDPDGEDVRLALAVLRAGASECGISGAGWEFR